MAPFLQLLVILIPALSVCSSSVGSNCTAGSCVSPFPFCDPVTGTCEVLGRASSLSRGWLPTSNIDDVNLLGMGCSVDGDYPSAECGTFYRCESGNATLMSCKSSSYPFFDPVLERCTDSNKCPTFDCTNSDQKKVGLKNTLSPFFAYCLKVRRIYEWKNDIATVRSIVMPNVITRCFGRDVFNPATSRCEPRCLQEGLIPDTSDCHNYFLCRLQDSVNSVFNLIKHACPKGEGFLYQEFRCVPEKDVVDCKKVFPSTV